MPSFSAAVLVAAGCAPGLTDDTSLIAAQRVIAAVVEPPEVHPGESITVRAVVASRGVRAAAMFTFCTTPPSPGDPRSVSTACLEEKGAPLDANGATATGTVPADACARFGPDPVSPEDRPRDPDRTGGFYQPVRIDALGEKTVAFVRIQCALPDAPADLARQLADTYSPNENPGAPALERRTAAGWGPFEAVTAGESVSLRVRWDTASRERYAYLPPHGTALEKRLESMSVSWFSDGGQFADSVTGRAEDDLASDTSNAFVAPQAGAFTLWIVLRDGRGGSAVKSQRIHVDAQ